MPEDFIDEVRKAKAAERARQTALAPPQRPARAPKSNGGGSGQAAYLETALRAEVDALSGLTKGTRNPALNTAAFNLGQLVNPSGLQSGVHGLEPHRIQSELEDACRRNGLWDDPEDGPSQCLKTLQSGYRAGLKQPRDLSDVGGDYKGIPAERAPKITRGMDIGSKIASPNHQGGSAGDLPERTIRLRDLSTVKSRVPTWVWEYEGYGRVQLGTLTMFAGKPAAGKSTGVRWFAARLSRGELPGVWFGHPMKVAVVMTEEQTDAVVVPGLAAADADLRNVFTPEFRFGDVESDLMAQADEQRLTEELCDKGIRALFVDPIMSTFSGKADVYRNNEVRQYLSPFTRIAKAINGIVVGVTHLRKGDVADVLGSINGSSAFGEVPRAVFGFAPIPNSPDFVFEQVKNSAGPTGLKLAYRLPIRHLLADDGQAIDLPHFDIIGPSEVGIADIASESDETTPLNVAIEWLRMYLLENQPAPSADVKKEARVNGDIKERTLKRASQRLGVVYSTVRGARAHQTIWQLPDDD